MKNNFILTFLSWYQETLPQMVLHSSVRLFSVPLADSTGLNYPVQPGSPSPFLQPFRRAGCVKKPGWGEILAELSINHWGQAEGVVYSQISFEYDEGDKECWFRPRNFSWGGFSRNQGLPTWKPDDSNLVQAFRLPRSPI